MFFRSYNSIKSLIVSSISSNLKSPIRRKFLYFDENESRLIFILFKWFSIFDLCWLFEQPNDHFLFLKFISPNITSTPSSKPATKSFEGIFSLIYNKIQPPWELRSSLVGLQSSKLLIVHLEKNCLA